MPCEIITEEMLGNLSDEVRKRLSEARFLHTKGVEKTARAMSLIYNPEITAKICAAALLHDITKEYSLEKQLKICSDFGIILRDDEKSAPMIIHAITSAAIIPSEFLSYACPEVIGAVRWHTTGRAGMTLPEKILCLADYIEDGRKYPDCVVARSFFWSEQNKNQSESERERIQVLDRALIMSFESTINHITAQGGVLNKDTQEALNYLITNPA